MKKVLVVLMSLIFTLALPITGHALSNHAENQLQKQEESALVREVESDFKYIVITDSSYVTERLQKNILNRIKNGEVTWKQLTFTETQLQQQVDAVLTREVAANK